MLVEAVTSAWRRGWQPAAWSDGPAGLTGRQVELLRRASASSSPATRRHVDARWRPQLEELAVHVAPSAGPEWLTAGDAGCHWLDVLQACADLVRFLGLLGGCSG